MPLTAQEALRMLQREGWVVTRQAGSHMHLERNGERIILPFHRGDLKPGLEKDIRQRAGWPPMGQNPKKKG